MHRLAARLFLLLAVLCAPPALATEFPVTVEDLAGRRVTISAPPQRLVLMDGNDLMILALLDRENPFRRVVLWNDNLRSSDPSLWETLRTRWPEAERIPRAGPGAAANISQERMLEAAPDLVVAQLSHRAMLEETALGQMLDALGARLVYVDMEDDPLGNTPRSIALLGRILDRLPEADAYLSFYAERLNAVTSAIAGRPRPRVFLEVRAGQGGLDQCCRAHGRSGFGLLLEAAGGENMAASRLPGSSGEVTPEWLLSDQPEAYILTGTGRAGRHAATLPIGHQGEAPAIHGALGLLLQRRGLPALHAVEQNRVLGLYHQFYKSPFNVVGVEFLARFLHPETLPGLQPDATYRDAIRRFTTIPAGQGPLAVSP